MAFLSSSERIFLRAVSSLGYCNPFLPERIEYERAALGPDFVAGEPIWSIRVDDPDAPLVNNAKVVERVEQLVLQLHTRLASGAVAPEQDLVLYEDAVLFLLFHRYRHHFDEMIVRATNQKRTRERCGFYSELLRDWEHWFHLSGVTLPAQPDMSIAARSNARLMRNCSSSPAALPEHADEPCALPYSQTKSAVRLATACPESPAQ